MQPVKVPFRAFFVLANKEQVVFHLPAELDGRHMSAMPAAKGDVVVVDVPVASLNLAQETALWTLCGAEDGIRPDIIGQHRKQKCILAVVAEEVEVTHQVEPQQQITLFLGKRLCRVMFSFLKLMTISDIWIVLRGVPSLEVLDTGDGHFKLLLCVRQLIRCRPCHPHRAEAHERQQSNPYPFHPSCSRC